jgi:hypothetical protein
MNTKEAFTDFAKHLQKAGLLKKGTAINDEVKNGLLGGFKLNDL